MALWHNGIIEAQPGKYPVKSRQRNSAMIMSRSHNILPKRIESLETTEEPLV